MTTPNGLDCRLTPDGCLRITGNTLEWKGAIKSLGAKWQRAATCWEFSADKKDTFPTIAARLNATSRDGATSAAIRPGAGGAAPPAPVQRPAAPPAVGNDDTVVVAAQRGKRNRSPPAAATTKKPPMANPSGAKKEEVLRHYFGFPTFNDGQAQVIDAILGGDSALAIFPTGGGKSLCYQLPAIMFPGTGLTLVISPLIALMKDQVDGLKKRNVEAEMLGSALTPAERYQVRQNVNSGKTRILYIAPEQVNNETTKALIRSRHIALLAIDEAHCISEWGHAFRPDYLRLDRFARDIGATRVLCLTATATPKVADDICKTFAIKKQNSVRTTFHRPNLNLDFTMVTEGARNSALIKLMNDHFDGPSLIYVTQQATTESVAKVLRGSGYDAVRTYHAGMSTEERTEVQEWFMACQKGIVVATIAFGMGIDKSNIRMVLHYNMPKSLEGYAQEIGRAGRDGKPSLCRLFLCPDDLPILEGFAHCDSPSAKGLYDILQDFFVINGSPVTVGTKRNVSLYTMARSNDIREQCVKMLLAFVDIYHRHIETLTPKYNNYQFQKPGDHLSQVRAVIASKVAPPNVKAAMSANLQVKATWAHLDIDQAARTPGVTREDIIGGIGQLENNGITVKASGVLQVFKVLSLPQSVRELAKAEHKRFSNREAQELARLGEVLSFITADSCQTKLLMEHFGEKPSADWSCHGNCRYCRTSDPVVNAKTAIPTDKPPAALWNPILADASIPKTDPRLLARFAFGERSPVITQAKLSSHRLFGSLVGKCTFDALLKACEAVCGRKDSDI